MKTLAHIQLDITHFEAAELEQVILSQCAAKNYDSGSVVLALSNVLARIAVKLDRDDGSYTLDDKLHIFCEQTKETYNRTYDIAER